MSQYLVSLHSPDAAKYSGALGILDTKSGIRYLQMDAGSPLVQKHQLRGVSILDDKVYVTTQASLRIYQIQSGREYPVFMLINEVVRKEWICGKWAKQADLLPVLASKERNRVYVGCNSLSSVDEFTLDGDFIGRRYLWDISPDIFSLPDAVKKGFRFGHIRSIGESESGEIVITVAFVGGEKNGVVISLDDGALLIGDLDKPHGGVFFKNRFYILNTQKAKLLAFNDLFKHDVGYSSPDWVVEPEIFDPKYSDSAQWMRGIVATDEEIVCGVCHHAELSEQQIPPRIVVFDTGSGGQIKEIYLPNIDDFPQPKVFSIALLPDGLNLDGESFGVCVDGEYIPDIQSNKKLRCEVKRSIGVSPGTDRNESNEDRSASVSVTNVSLHYRRQAHFFLSKDRHLRKTKNFLALDDVSFTLYEGETVGIIGRNGSGKSTLSRLICGALMPDDGRLVTYGRVQLLSLGVGFSNDLTGRENVFISGTLMGLTRSNVSSLLPDIESFAELGEFMDEPVRTYSSGMRSRLGFAIATAVSPDILILDEVMSTGDQSFRKRAMKRMNAMRESVKTVIIVSHSSSQVKKMCTRVLWFEKGRLMEDGSPRAVVSEYDRFSQNPEKWLDRHVGNKEGSDGL